MHDVIGSISRRHLLIGGGAFILGTVIAGNNRANAANIKKILKPNDLLNKDLSQLNAFVQIRNDGTIEFLLPSIEMGQGTHTGESMLIAEELEVELSQVKAYDAPANKKLYANHPMGDVQTTSASSAIPAFWTPLRTMGASARMMLCTAAAQQWNVPVEECFATKATVVHQPTGRVKTYGALAKIAATLPVPSAESLVLKKPDQFKLIGQPVKRLDTPDKVNGRTCYAIDVELPGMKCATSVFCPTYGGKVISIDDRKTRQLQGVVDVLNLGDSVVVIAEHFWIAKKGADLLRIEWDAGQMVNVNTESMLSATRDGIEKVTPMQARKEGDATHAISKAPSRYDAVYEAPFLAHMALEPICCAAYMHDGICEVWGSVQLVSDSQELVARITKLPLEKVFIHNHLIGGSFGRRENTDFIGHAVQVAMKVSYPVKVQWTRETDIQRDHFRPPYYAKIEAGLDSSGRPIAWKHRFATGSLVSITLGELAPGEIDYDAIRGAVGLPYDFTDIDVEWSRVDPPVAVGWMRGVGFAHNVFAVEGFIDELAHKAGVDPLQFRMDLIKSCPRAKQVLSKVAEEIHWNTPAPANTGRGLAVAQANGGSFVAAAIEVTMENNWVQLQKIRVAIDCGIVVNPDIVKAQMEGGILFGLSNALYNKLDFDKGGCVQRNFNDFRCMRINDAPKSLETFVMESQETPTGVGETAVSVAAPALVNAIFHACGKRIRSLPVIGNAALAPQ